MIDFGINPYVSWPRIMSRGGNRGTRNILVTQPWVSHLSWLKRPAFVRASSHRRLHLFAGPWVGEFGWELMGWQGVVRALSSGYEHVTVCARETSKALYADCCDTFIAHTIQGQSNAHVVFSVSNPEELQRVLAMVPDEADHLVPMRYVPGEAQSFIRFGNAAGVSHRTDVLIHARGGMTSSNRNWMQEKWCALVRQLQALGFHVGAIGLSKATLDIDDVIDLRDIPLEQTMDQIAASKIVVGPSSGPMHLASLCETPHLVWTDRRTYSMRRTSRCLYEETWNPHDTPVLVLDEFGFDPPVDVVFDGMMRLLVEKS